MSYIEKKNCNGIYRCDPPSRKDAAWGRQFTSYPAPINDILDEYSYEQLQVNPGGIGTMPAGTVLKTTDGVTKLQ